MFVAVCDQNFGNSTLRCSNAGPLRARDVRVAHLPLDLVERIAAGDGEQTADGEPGVLVDDAVDEFVGVDLNALFRLRARHLLLLYAVQARAR